jgi:hypothetical protein
MIVEMGYSLGLLHLPQVLEARMQLHKEAWSKQSSDATSGPNYA